MRGCCRTLGVHVLAAAALALVSASSTGAELLVNGTFDTNIDGWSDPGAYPDTVIAWTFFDPHDDPASGALSVTTNLSDAGLDGPWQCAVTAPGPHAASAMAYRHYPPQHIEPFVEMSLDFFASDDCSGAPLEGGLYDVTISGDYWEPLAVQTAAPAATRSAMVRFLVGGTYDTYADQVSFDDASLLPEPGSAALAVAALVALRLVGRGARGALNRQREPCPITSG